MPSNVRVTVRVDRAALNRELKHRTGAVGKVIAGFGGEVTKEIKSEFRDRAGGAWWPVRTSIVDGGNRGVVSSTTVRKSKAHRITAVNVPRLVFFWERENRMFIGQSVNHPGSTPPVKLVLSGIDRASRRIAFTRTAPTATSL